jgi:hypothetical protein
LLLQPIARYIHSLIRLLSLPLIQDAESICTAVKALVSKKDEEIANKVGEIARLNAQVEGLASLKHEGGSRGGGVCSTCEYLKEQLQLARDDATAHMKKYARLEARLEILQEHGAAVKVKPEEGPRMEGAVEQKADAAEDA